MLIKTRLYLIAIIFIILSVVALLFSIRNKNAATCKVMAWACGLAIVFLWASIFLGPLLCVNFNLEILFFYLFGAIGSVVYIVSIVINVAKRKSIMKTYFATEFNAPHSLKVFLLLLFILPVLFASFRIVRDRVLIATSDAIVVFYSGGNGGIGDSKLFAFAIDGKKCKQFDLGIELGLDELVPKAMVRVKPYREDWTVGEYHFTMDENEGLIFKKDGQKFYQYNTHKHDYFNIDLQEAYYKQK